MILGTFLGKEWKLSSILDFIYQSPVLYELLEDPDNLVLIHRGDAFPCAGKQCLLMTVTLANFGVLSNVELFNFLSNWSYTSDKDSQIVERAWGDNLEVMRTTQLTEKIFVPCRDLTLPCKLKYRYVLIWFANFSTHSGDESWF